MGYDRTWGFMFDGLATTTEPKPSKGKKTNWGDSRRCRGCGAMAGPTFSSRTLTNGYCDTCAQSPRIMSRAQYGYVREEE